MKKISQQYFCPNCGASIEQGTKFCANCGTQIAAQPQQVAQPQPAQPAVVSSPTQSVSQVVQVQMPGAYPQGPSQKSRLVALLLCIFFGYLGFHRFYVGKIGSGVLYLLTVGVWGIGWVIDCIIILLGGLKDGMGLLVTNW